MGSAFGMIGAVKPHDIHAHYIGWTGNGHIKRLNISHAVYEVLGHDELNPVAGRKTYINAQMGALELSSYASPCRQVGASVVAPTSVSDPTTRCT